MRLVKRYSALVFLGIAASATFAALTHHKESKNTKASQSSSHSSNDDRLLEARLDAQSSPNSGQTIDCGSTTMPKPEPKVALCASAAFEDRKPFHALYANFGGFFHFGYGLAGDSQGNIYEVLYDSRGLLHLSMGRNSQVFDGNRIRVKTCMKPVRLGETEEGMLACVTPVDEQESRRVAQEKPIETTVCAILEHPAAFNNKMVRIHGYVSGNFEYSDLGADGCSNAIWFASGNGGSSPDLVATVGGTAAPGAEDDEGRLILPIQVKLVQDSNFRRFQKLMKARASADKQSESKDPDNPVFHRVTAKFVGRIDGVSDGIHSFHLKRKPMDRADYLGFGQMGLFDAQFVVQSVENDSVLEAFPPVPSKP